METPTLIFCGGNNRTLGEIAISCGYKYGCRLPNDTPFFPPYFVDQDWKNPNRKLYVKHISKYRPYIASVLDLERLEQLSEVLSWAEEIIQFVEVVMIVPKANGCIEKLPHTISGKQVRLGYSVPTKHGGTSLGTWEFKDWPIHLLGGSPASQMRLCQYLNVASVDGNMSIKMANRGLFWQPGKIEFSNSWTSILNSDGSRWNGNAMHEAFYRSCKNIANHWNKLFED